MYIKKIKLQGFKSFLNKTEITLKRGVTSIVGPNGCGKTNIIDAIRWVLGEQKQSMLRSSKMQDVIFNGTQKIKPINFCQVTITIDNDLQILPIEYSDVEVSRRLFRTGESEYYINKNLCRLKDVHELFVDTGMGSDAYSVIELKMIENILSNDNSNFKKMLDEAAGISNYNQKRRSTQNKLKNVMNNLDRVNDIIFEVDKNMKLLHLQMKRYNRHESLVSKLKDKEILLSSLKILKLIEKQKPIDKQLKTRNKDESAIVKKIEIDDGLFKNLEKEESVLKNQITKLKDDVDKMNQKLHLSNAQIIKYTENKKYNNSQTEYYKDQISQSNLNIEHFKIKSNELKQDLLKIAPVIKKRNKDFSIFEKKYINNRNKRDSILKEIRKENDSLYSLFSDLSKLKNKKMLLESNYDSLKKHLIDLEKFQYDKNCKYCVKNGKEQINEKSTIKKKVSKLKKSISQLDVKIKTCSKNHDKKKIEINKMNDSLIELNNKNEKYDEQFQNFKIQNIELQKEKEGLDYRLKSMIESEDKIKVQIDSFNKSIKELDNKNKSLDSDINSYKKDIDKIKVSLKKNIATLSRLDKSYNNINSKIKDIQNSMILNRQKKEEKIIDKQNLEMELSNIRNDQKIILNFIKEKYSCNINENLNSKEKAVDLFELTNEIQKIKKSIENIGPINMAVESEYQIEKERFNFLSEQKSDLINSEKVMQKTILKLDKEAKEKFLESFELINKNLIKTFSMFFNGGESYLKLLDQENPLESNIEIIAKPPGKKNKTLKMLSSGEKALSATAILFAIYLKKPSPFCILDEIDSPLDDSNIKKFTDVIRDFSNNTQFIIITHNKLTMQESDYMYGITQQEEGISDVVSVQIKN